MLEKNRQFIWNSMHGHYISYAVDAAVQMRDGAPEPRTIDGFKVRKEVVDAIRYSFDALEASLEHVLYEGIQGHLNMDAPSSNWLFDSYLKRRWNGLPLVEKLGLLSYAWRAVPFFRTEKELGLFNDLRHARDQLTHLRPSGAEYSISDVTKASFKNQFTVEVYATKRLPDEAQGKPPKGLTNQVIRRSKGIADFAKAPKDLGVADAELAVEIMLHHLARLQDIFFEGKNHFKVFGGPFATGATCAAAIKYFGTRFGDVWAPKAD